MKVYFMPKNLEIGASENEIVSKAVRHAVKDYNSYYRYRCSLSKPIGLPLVDDNKVLIPVSVDGKVKILKRSIRVVNVEENQNRYNAVQYVKA